MPDLANTLEEIRRRIQAAAKRPLNEYNTKATLIEPVLRALGWNVENVDEVEREYKHRKSDKPVDYGLTISCYQPAADGTAGGVCDACALRRKGFAEAGAVDPTRYREESRP